ncbi:MAG: hypothetical protein Q8K92_25045 [Leadbetterella sp.]|nr:hypothetical protein [Leadbetterella sp.]
MDKLNIFPNSSHSINDQLIYLKYYYINSAYREFYNKITGEKIHLKKYAGKIILNSAAGNDYIKAKILGGGPFMAGRFGSGELKAVVQALGVNLNILKEIKETTLVGLCSNAGFFPKTQDSAMKFGELMAYMCHQVDLICVWMNVMEDYVIRTYARQAQITRLRAIEPYYHNEPWSKALEGKKILVIHPFEKTIKSQYQKREFLFLDKNTLPAFELKTLKAVQTIAGQISDFNTWFDALEYMFNKALAIEFDVALVGCGAYGFPLAAKLKEAGKQVVHLGGATQILFGIKGRRWDNHPIISNYYNKYWVRPLQEETPSSSGVVEDGCYW